MPSRTHAKTPPAKSVVRPKDRQLVWEGPAGQGPQGGVTQGLLGRYLACSERLRLLVVEGLKGADRFSAPMEFGSLWHSAEEALAGGKCIETHVSAYATRLMQKYPMDREEINHWYQKCLALFPVYVEHWSRHPDVIERTPLLQEQVFDVPHRLPSGRTVRLRGKWDSVDLIGKGKDAGIYLQENKSKSSVDSKRIQQQLTFDLQTLAYLIALKEWQGQGNRLAKVVSPNGGIVKLPILGVRYNVVKRSAHKTSESMMKKVLEDQANGRIGEWFGRWKVEIEASDVIRFRRECLDPVLENLLDDFEWWADCHQNYGDVWDYRRRAKQFPHHQHRHFRLPFGVWNVTAEGGASEVDEYMRTGSVAGLVKTSELFPELKEGG